MRSYEEDFGGFPPDTPCHDEDIEPGSTLVLVADHVTPMHDHRHADGSLRSILDEDVSYDLAVGVAGGEQAADFGLGCVGETFVGGNE